MSARQQTIYEVKVEPLLQANPFQLVGTTYTYFSNLKRAIDTVQTMLAAYGWEVTVHYSTVYRSLKLRGVFYEVFWVEGVRYFQMTISPRPMNPHLSTLGIDEMPRPRKK